MNYRHDFHAGNFADVLKHVVLTRILLYLHRKPTPFRMIDTHAGSGRYDLGGALAARTLEWRGGIDRVRRATMSAEAAALAAPYLALTGDETYPGSPAIAMALTRPLDRMIFCELHPDALVALRGCVGRDRRAKVMALDGYQGLNAFIPPVERRGLVLVDPPFEDALEFDRLGAALLAAHAKWREGILVAWHPIKDRRGAEGLAARLASAGIDDVLRLELQVDDPRPDGPLAANGLVIVNPPFTLADEMHQLLPEFAHAMATGHGAARVIG